MRTATFASPRCAPCRAGRIVPRLPRLEAIVKGKAVRDADLTEKMAFFEAYGALCGDGGSAQSRRYPERQGLPRPA